MITATIAIAAVPIKKTTINTSPILLCQDEGTTPGPLAAPAPAARDSLGSRRVARYG